MNEIVLIVGISVMSFCVAYALFAAERRLSDVQCGLEDLITVMMEKNTLSETVLELGETVRDLSEKNNSLYRELLEKRANEKESANDNEN